MAVFCSSFTSCFPGMLLTYFLNDSETVPVAPIITGITFLFTFHMRCISVVKSLYFRIFIIIIIIIIIISVDRGSAVGIATRYGMDGPGIETRCGRDFPHPSTPARGPPSLLYNGYRVFLGGKTAGA